MACSCLVLQDDEIGRRPVERDTVAGNEQAARACIGLLHEDAMAALERDAIEHRAAEKVGVLDDTTCGGASRTGGVARREADFFGTQCYRENAGALRFGGGRQRQDQALARIESQATIRRRGALATSRCLRPVGR